MMKIMNGKHFYKGKEVLCMFGNIIIFIDGSAIAFNLKT